MEKTSRGGTIRERLPTSPSSGNLVRNLPLVCHTETVLEKQTHLGQNDETPPAKYWKNNGLLDDVEKKFMENIVNQVMKIHGKIIKVGKRSAKQRSYKITFRKVQPSKILKIYRESEGREEREER